MTIQELQKKAGISIQKGSTNLALQELNNNISSLHVVDKRAIKLLSARYKKNETNYTIEGAISQTSYSTEFNSINKALLQIIEQLHLEKKLNDYPHPPSPNPNIKLYAMITSAVLVIILVAILFGRGNINITGNDATVIKGNHTTVNQEKFSKEEPTQNEKKELEELKNELDENFKVDENDK